MSHVFFTGFTRSTNYLRINKLNDRIYQSSSLQKSTGGFNWSIDISSILRDQKYALREIKEQLESEGDGLFEMPPDDTKLSKDRLIFCANIVGIIRHLEKRTSIPFETYNYTEAQKQYIEDSPSQKELLVRQRELTWQFILKQDFYRPLCNALEETRFTQRDFCRSISVIHETLTDIVMSQHKYTPNVREIPIFAGEVECLPEHVECFQVFINILK